MLFDRVSLRFALSTLLLNLLNLSSKVVADDSYHSSDCHIDGLEDRLRCGYVTVAEDPKKPNGRTINIHYVIVSAVKPLYPSEALLAIAGGPGQSAIDNAALFNQTFSKVRETRDILLIDQRGTGRSNLLSCPEDKSLSPLSIDERLFDNLAETKKCLATFDADVAMYNSSFAIHDFEAVRNYLGYTKLHLYGISYGSRMAQLYMRHYPESLATVTLDGVVPMQQSVLAVGLSVNRALDGVFDQCESNKDCNEQFPNLRLTLNQLNDRLENKAIETTVFHPATGAPTTFLLTRDKLLGILRLSMYSPATRSLVPLTIDHTAAGNYQSLLGLYSLTMDGLDMAIGMHNSVACAEDIHRIDDDLLADIKQSYTANAMYQALLESCSIWPTEKVNDSFFAAIESDIPTLLLSGELDPATPPNWGTLAMEKMTNAKHFVAPYATHGVATQSCGNDLVAELIDQGSLNDLDNSCLSKDHPRGFYLNASTAQALPNDAVKEDSP